MSTKNGELLYFLQKNTNLIETHALYKLCLFVCVLHRVVHWKFSLENASLKTKSTRKTPLFTSKAVAYPIAVWSNAIGALLSIVMVCVNTRTKVQASRMVKIRPIVYVSKHAETKKNPSAIRQTGAQCLDFLQWLF